MILINEYLTSKEVKSALGWSVRSKNGFYCNGKHYTGITSYSDDPYKIDLINSKNNYFLSEVKVKDIIRENGNKVLIVDGGIEHKIGR